MTSPTKPPIFILGMLQRTGTNHLWDLFGLHPDVELLKPVFEDHLVRWSPHLFAYTDDVTSSWDPEWQVPADEGASLVRSIGNGISDWIANHSERRIVTKMPTVEQAQRFFELFPKSPLIVIIRDGRNVAESMTSTFDMSYERSFRRWSLAANVVLELQREYQDRAGFKVVRYEDVVDNPLEVMRELCEVTGLDTAVYPYDEVAALPVRGSSTLRTEQGAEMHWTPVERSESFDPHSRWQKWTDHEHRRFAKAAGNQQLALGYELKAVEGSDTLSQQLTDSRDRAYTLYRELRVKAGRAQRSIRRVHGRI